MKFAHIAALIGGLLATAPASAETLIRIGYPGTGIDDRPYAYGDYIAVANVQQLVEAEFKDVPDVKVSWTFFRGAGPALNESLAAGQLDFAAGLGDLPSIVGRSRGLQTKYLASASSHDALYLAVPPDSQLKTVEDLKGHKVAQFRGTNLQIATDRVLEKHGLTEKDIRFVSLDSNAATAALVSGNVEASFGGSEYLDLAKRGAVKIIYSTKNDDPTLGRNSGLLVTAEFEKAHPEFTAKVVRAFVKAARFGSDEANRQAVFELWSKAGLPVESFEADFKDEPLAHRLSPVVDDFIIARYKDQAERAKVYGLIKKDVDIDSWFETKYLKQALIDLKLENYWSTFDAKGQKVTEGEVEHTKAASN
ncbi:ABC transporter substrate-binding protein [Mesorhizobium sp.]|uniref:ABC transporter substrate-binding protein n=1 Tax=Mesorhizobium sp. TaxID=1871066 RepID=UPI000FE74293|nr:ABC transporter substrate-binding protein [Mesorhizobium sp.]RWJ01246.1 MAG: nitrate ABC transporter substrate-binding protein [Mesorhizobium sp.]TIP95579.1 MAG: nitrate ABC transporter substrate-binding protein [Mesorhizobium sp.]